MGRAVVTVVALAGAAVAGIAAQAGESRVGALALALLAGIALSLMLRGSAVRILGVLLTVLAVTAAGWSAQLGEWVSFVGFVITAIASTGFVLWGPTWQKRHRSDRDRPVDFWQAMDEGDDPTDEQGVHRSTPSG